MKLNRGHEKPMARQLGMERKGGVQRSEHVSFTKLPTWMSMAGWQRSWVWFGVCVCVWERDRETERESHNWQPHCFLSLGPNLSKCPGCANRCLPTCLEWEKVAFSLVPLGSSPRTCMKWTLPSRWDVLRLGGSSILLKTDQPQERLLYTEMVLVHRLLWLFMLFSWKAEISLRCLWIHSILSITNAHDHNCF